MDSKPDTARERSPATFFWAIAAGITFIVLVYAHFGPVNGPSYFRWPWYRRSDNVRTAGLLLLAASPALLAQLLTRRKHAVAVALVIATPALLQATGISLWTINAHGVARARAILEHPTDTSYLSTAEQIEGRAHWLRDFDQVLLSSQMHAATKPPGPISFFLALISIFGREQASLAAAVIILFFGCASVAAAYAAFRSIAGGGEVALQAATLLALLPSMVAIYPVVDWLSPVFSVSAVALWHVALRDRSLAPAAAFGVIVFSYRIGATRF